MNIKEQITRFTNLELNDSLSAFKGHAAQQNHNAFEVFYDFIKKTKPKRILEIGTSLGGFTTFLKIICDELNLETNIRSYDINEFPWYKDIIELGVDIRVENIFTEGFLDMDEEVKNYIQQDGVTIVLCDGGWKIGEFNLISDYIKSGDFILAHDYAENKEYFELNIQNKIWNWMEIQDSDIEDSVVKNNLKPYMPEEFKKVVWVCKMKDTSNDSSVNISVSDSNPTKRNNITLVTGIWNIGRDELSEGWSRSYQHYLDKFEKLLNVEENLIIFGDENLRDFVFEKRNESNTQFIVRPLSWFKNNDYYNTIQEIRNNESWYNQVGWLKESTQAKLEMYNPLVMSKMFLLHDAKITDKFNSEYLFWIDGGLTNTVHPGYFTHDKVLDKLSKYISKFSFICFPYETNSEIHGFEYSKLKSIANCDVKKVARGGFFGGPKNTIPDINSIYYGILMSSLNDGYMGTEESIFSIMCHKHSDIINYFEIDGNGLINKFFEDLKNDTLKVKSENKLSIENTLDINKVGLYVITFNSPNQFETLIYSMNEYDKDFILKPKKFLLDNSTDLSTTKRYKELCDEYGFEHIKKDNIGIVGGRVFVAEHFDETDLDFYYWFEDDMAFYPKKGEVCRNGFNRFVPNLYSKTLQIIKNENFDFLKLSFTEFYGSNDVQFSWYNVPQDVRVKLFPEKTSLPSQGLDPNAPRTKFNNIKIHQGLPYANGEIYLSNWPILLSKSGNYKCYLETKWARPFEQTLMSYCYQETVKGNITPGILLLTPTEHNRFEHYESNLRKES